MVLPRPTVLRGFAPARLFRSAPRTANRAISRRGYASSHGGHSEPSSDVPWALGAVAVTLPTCYYLWPSGSHAEAHHDPNHETKAERAEQLTHEGDNKEPAETEEKPTPENKGDTEDVQFKGKSAAGDEDNKVDDNRKVEDDNKGAKKLRIESGAAKDLGEGASKRDDGSDSAATSKDISENEGDMSNKQKGIATTATKHSTDIANDPEKSKKGEGSPETAKSQGTVSVNRPQTEKRKGETEENVPNPEAAEEKKDDKPEEKEEKEEKSEEKKEE
ncbi:hypothetical protein AAFC00_000632 [Neodothiora populina]|uniref:Uncharacterized protein n=1 Tax=Neodothiora populina TaxID=2781224 RepID=A0ABR3PEQ9_9PEZI